MSGSRLRHGLLVRLLGGLTGAAIVVVPVLGYELARGSADARDAVRTPPAVSQAGLETRSGVHLVRVTASGRGGLLDVRYRVVDPDKAVSVHERATPPAVIDERTGTLVDELFMGHMPHGQPKAGVSYYLIFANRGGVVGRGSRVTVQLGDARLPHVVVR